MTSIFIFIAIFIDNISTIWSITFESHFYLWSRLTACYWSSLFITKIKLHWYHWSNSIILTSFESYISSHFAIEHNLILISHSSHFTVEHNLILISLSSSTVITSSMNSSENIKEITLTSLITENRVTLKKEIVLQYQLSIEEKEKIKIENEISRIYDYFIKYLNVNTHFFISKNTTSFSNICESSIRSIKSTSNVQMMKRFCELIKDFAINKRWIKFKKFRVTAEQAMFLLVLNKKIKDVDYTTLNLSIVTTLVFHFVTIHESRIAQNKVWFTRNMFTTQNRVNATKIMTKKHLQWKIQVHTQYKEQCRRYVKQRILWEIQLMKKALEVSNIIWSIDMSNENRLSLLRNVKISTNCKALIEVEND
jgi:hypothetical protein